MKKKLNVAFFMHNFAGGGVERMRLALSAALPEERCNVSIVVVNSSGPLATEVPRHIKLVNLNSSRLLWAVSKLRRYLLAHRPDVLVSSLDHNNIAALCACLFLRHKTRLIICQHNALSQEVQLSWKYRLVPHLYKLLAGRAAAIVAVSQGVANDLAAISGLPRNKIYVISNPVVHPASTRLKAFPPHPWFEDPSVRVFISAGRLAAQKDPATLINAFSHHLASNNRSRLIIIGDGPLRAEMIEMTITLGIADHIYFAGFVMNAAAWISHAHALLLTSRYEGFANVIVEALACGVPVIATNCPHGPAEILEDGRYGRLIGIGDPLGLASAMQEDLRVRFPANLLRDRALDFTVQAAADKYMALFEHCIARDGLVFGLKFSRETPKEIAKRVMTQEPATTKLIITPNIDHVRLMLSKSPFRQACLAADTVCADGWPVALYAAARGATRSKRVTGCEIVHHLISNDQIFKVRAFIVVECMDSAVALVHWLASRCPTAPWTVEVAPPNLATNLEAQSLIAEKIRSAEPRLLLMTLGAPTSEVFVSQNALPKCWAICIGQGLRVELGLTARAPQAWRNWGLEWAWRCCLEPRRLGPRYLRSLISFPYAILLDLFQRGRLPLNEAVGTKR